MAGKNRDQDTDLSVLEAMLRDPFHFGFYEALRQLECLYKQYPRLGKSLTPQDEKVRLGQEASLRFAPSSLAACKTDTQGLIRLQVLFFGLFGPNGPLPLHLTEYARHRLRDAKDPVFAEFIDLFHHRLLSLFYRAWADKEPTVQYDRPESDRFGDYIGSLFGLGMSSLYQRDAMEDHLKRHFAGHLGSQKRNAEGLGAILSSYFALPVSIDEFIGEWLRIPDDSYCYLDGQENTGQLGQSAVIGALSWQCQHKFRIRIGPLNYVDYQRLLPGNDSLESLQAIVRNYIGFEFNWDLNLIMDKQQVPPARLGEFGRLGWTTWVQTQARGNDADELYLQVENY